MIMRHFLIFAIICGGVFSNENSQGFRKLLTKSLQNIPYLRLELREGKLSDFENVYVDFLLRQTHCSVMVSTYNLIETKDLLNLRESFAIMVDMGSLDNTVQYFAQAAGSFFFIIPDAIDQNEVVRIFRQLWYTRGIFRILLLTVDGLMFYDPIAFDQATQTFGDLKSFRERDLFANLNGYPLRLQIFRSVYARPLFGGADSKEFIGVDGADAQVAYTLQERMNFTMVLQQPTKNYFGDRSANGTYNGAIGMIINHETDISLTGFFVKDYMVPDVEFTVAVYDDQLCCYVPKAPRIPQSILPIFAVRMDFWLGFILTGFICGTVWVFMRRVNLFIASDELSKLHLSRHLRHQVVRIYIDTWVVWVRVNIVSYPPFSSERIFILSLCLVSVIFGAIIESSLATVYIHPMYYKDINNLRELDESGLEIIYKYKSFKDDLFFSETSPLFAALNKKLKHLNNLSADVMNEVAETGGIASVTRYSSLMLESINYVLAKKVHIVRECPKYYTIAYVMPKDSPFGERINSLLLRFLNGGLINKWIKDMHAKANMVIMKTHEIEGSNVFKVLTMIDLQLAFYVVILGSIMGVIAFGVEIYMKYKRTS